MAAAFNTRAASYCRNEWHRTCAERLVALCELPAGCRVLDACTGTGFAALAVARVVGREGRVVGVDVSAGMLVEAERATLTSGLTNIEFVEGDASQLPRYANGAFDAVMCAAGLLYLNVPDALREWYRLLRRGGILGFTTMRAGSPRAAQIFRDCAAAFGVPLQDPSAELGKDEACRQVLADAGFSVARVVCESIEFAPQDLSVAWESNFHSPAHAGVQRLSEREQQALRCQYLEALGVLQRQSPGELSLAEVLYAVGVR
jgi:ubiquinone/menaquinone biosynthesis C-methylase UbiE